jgi:uncharacterized membrane protein HdeD (DUF308 family)
VGTGDAWAELQERVVMAGASSLIIRGIIGVIFGIVAFLWTGATLAFLIVLFGAYALLDGIADIAHGISSARADGYGWFLILEGIVGIGAGIVTFLWPAITMVVLVIVIGIWAVFTGILELIAAIRLRNVIKGEWLLALSAILSIALGVLLFLYPVTGAVVLAWLVGAYAFVAGIVLIALGVRLRAHRVPITAG